VTRDKIIKLIVLGVMSGICFIVPPPQGLGVEGWRLAGIFVAAIMGLVVQVIPEAALLLIAVTIATLFVVPLKEVLVGYMDSSIWLVVIAIMLSHGFKKSGLTRRIGLFLISSFGKSSLRVAYCISFLETILASSVPSTPARTGGIVFPLAEGFIQAVDPSPKERPRRIAAYLIFLMYALTITSGSLYLTGLAPNPFAAKLANDVLGTHIDWSTWTMAAFPGFLGMLVIPWLIYKVYPPELKNLDSLRQSAKANLEEMGRVSRKEWAAGLIFVTVLALWATGKWTRIDATVVAFVGISLMFLLEVIKWQDLAESKEIISTLIWFGGIIGLSSALAKYNFFNWLAAVLKAALPTTGLPVFAVFVILALIANLPHYFFASTLGYVAAFAPLMFTFIAASDVPRYPAAFLSIFLLITSSTVTHYSNVVGPLLFGTGYVDKKSWWGLGLLCAIYHSIIYLTLGLAYWKWIGLWY
jgi:divalent anion:Na+ symporter, DASS family